MDIICAWCTLKKEINEYGQAMWPEFWHGCKPEYAERGSPEYNDASHGICPECMEKLMKRETYES